MNPIWVILLVLLAAVIAGTCGYLYRKNVAERKIGRTEEYAKRLYDDAVQKADEYKRNRVLEAKDEILREKDVILQAKEESAKELRERRNEVQKLESRLLQREQTLDKKESNLDAREEKLNQKTADVQQRMEEADALHARQAAELERVASMTQDEAKQIIIDRVQKEAYHDAAGMIREIEAKAKEEADKKARNIVAMAIQRVASDHVTESTVSVIALPNDDMKGRIIGREGRNIRALETATGVDLIIDDTPEAVIVSAFDPVRREIARIAVERLIADGRIHPAHIEEMVEKAKREVEQQIREAGENAVFEVNLHGIHPEIVRTMGKLKYRTSYGQNVLKHSIEVAHIAGIMAAELGADVHLAKRGGFLHDLGKAIDHEMEGSHIQLGADMARKYGEPPDVIHAILAHHNEIEPQTVEAVLVQAADAVSAARPGARRESLENYIKRLEKLESIATSFNGVEKCFAIQSGREVRIMVKPDDVSDEGTRVLAKEVAKRIEEEMEYPGQIRVNVIRETRSMELAK